MIWKALKLFIYNYIVYMTVEELYTDTSNIFLTGRSTKTFRCLKCNNVLEYENIYIHAYKHIKGEIVDE